MRLSPTSDDVGREEFRRRDAALPRLTVATPRFSRIKQLDVAVPRLYVRIFGSHKKAIAHSYLNPVPGTASRGATAQDDKGLNASIADTARDREIGSSEKQKQHLTADQRGSARIGNCV